MTLPAAQLLSTRPSRRPSFARELLVAALAAHLQGAAAIEASDCWSGGFTPERCCGADRELRDCFDAVYTEELCCGSGSFPDGSAYFAAGDADAEEEGCSCDADDEELLSAVRDAVVDARGDRSGPLDPGGSFDAMPVLAVAASLCERFEHLLLRASATCLLTRVAGGAVCAHSARLSGNAARASSHAEAAAAAAGRLGDRRKQRCPLAAFFVSPAFPFWEAEAVRNAERFRREADSTVVEKLEHDAAARIGWRREPKPQLGARSLLDDIARKYRASSAMRRWQKQFGCSGGDTGEDGNFYSPVYSRLFEHEVPAASNPPGPSRHRPTRILEIGVCDGSGVAMWSEYFRHEASRIVAMDLDKTLFGGNRPYLCQKGLDLSRLAAVIEANASDLAGEASVTVNWGLEGQSTSAMKTADALRAHGPFDFIRDDASHIASDMIATFEGLFVRFLRPGGVYVVEDMWSYPAVKNVGTSLDDSGEYAYFFKLARDAANMGWRYDGAKFSSVPGSAWIQSSAAGALEAWVDSVEFARGQVVIRKRHASS
eukprot:TRINITY_DN5558_c0_g3_i1.p1 TRINITY_DN5558_c0_g3~~TRINITY_DN5558_c0_g3_i1.p1  ORF type:complete len:543 (+),score=121.68 TRINITY_DN5558_c0_g3_i1:50-1678(+)